MKKAQLLALVAALVLSTFAGVPSADETQTLTGEFVWTDRDNRGDLEAVFTTTGKGTWDVSFHFTFRGKPHVYSGTAEGSLSSGELKGKVFNESKKRTFTFEGTFEDGRFQGTHAEIEGDGTHSTGTLSLSS